MLQMIFWELWNGGNLCHKEKSVEKETQKCLVYSNG
jgi:hypothetical protein